MQIPDFFRQDHLMMAIFGRYLIKDDKRVKTLQLLVDFFYCFIKTLTLLPKGHANKF